MIGILGDVHAHYDELFDTMGKHPEIDIWLQVGDLGAVDKTYPSFPSPFYFISGNHENWDEIEKIDKGQGPRNLHHIKNGDTIELEGLKILGFGGNYSPKYSNTPDIILPQSRRRHNTVSELSKAMEKKGIDLFICHEAPSPYITRNKDAGIININKILIAVKPKLCFFGHHHYLLRDKIYEGILCTGLSYGWESFISFDPKLMSYHLIKKVNTI